MRNPTLFSLTLLLASALDAVRADNPDGVWGWPNFTPATGYQETSFPVQGSASLFGYIDDTYDASKIKRVILQIHGHGRDCWNYAKHTTKARNEAAETMGLDPTTILSIAPEFLAIGDMNAGSFKPSNNYLCWLGDEWSGGYQNIPDCTPGVTNITAFQAMDALVGWASDKTRFPSVDTVVVSGHSLGGQYTTRYAALGKAPQTDGVDIEYWVGNAASYLYLSDARPASRSDLQDCSTYDDYKYGVNGLQDVLGEYGPTTAASGLRSQIWSTYASRNVHTALGLADSAAGNLGCEGLVQGQSHLDRGLGYMNFIQRFAGGLPTPHTVDYFPGVKHDAGKMLIQPTSLKRLFFDRTSDGTVQPSQDGGSIFDGTKLKFWSTLGRVTAQQLAALGQKVVHQRLPAAPASAPAATSASTSTTSTSAKVNTTIPSTARQGVSSMPVSTSSASSLAQPALVAISFASLLLLLTTL